MRWTLPERRALHAQERARLAQTEAGQQERARQQRLAHLRRVGELAEKAGLLALPSAELLGVLLAARDKVSDQAVRDMWRTTGSDFLAREEQEKAKSREPVIIQFPEPITPPTRMVLRAAGFHQSQRRGDTWEGIATIAEAEAIALVHRGAVRSGGSPARTLADFLRLLNEPDPDDGKPSVS